MSQTTIKPWVVANWKMNPVQQDAQVLTAQLKHYAQQQTATFQACHVAVAPTMLQLLQVQQQLVDTGIHCVAQDLSTQQGTGAYTGEVSATLLKDSQIDYVLIGHSERRELFADDVARVQTKIKNALAADVRIIYCVGESLQQREQGIAEQVVLQQVCDLAAVVENADDWQHIAIAYEPIWAIGTGKTASAQDAQAMHASIRQGLAQITPYAMQIALLYGGSVKAENAAELAQCADINGALVGGASLNADAFYQIIQAFAQAKA
ncbi:MAG: triose-phosphate isomerase [Acinetobacter sp.]|nr:triose-phosphate isomerase [Acinetobacter sp.]